MEEISTNNILLRLRQDNKNNDFNNSSLSYKKEAFSRLYDQYAGSVLGYIYTIINEKEIAEEILARVFICMWNDFENFPDFNKRCLPRLMAIANKEVPVKSANKSKWVQQWKSEREIQVNQ